MLCVPRSQSVVFGLMVPVIGQRQRQQLVLHPRNDIRHHSQNHLEAEGRWTLRMEGFGQP